MAVKVLAQIITNVLTAFYQPFGFSVVLSVLAMFFYLFAYAPDGAGRGWKAAGRDWNIILLTLTTKRPSSRK